MPFNYNSVKKITNEGIVDASLTGDDFAGGAVNAASVAAGDITGDKINAANITADKIGDTSITETAIADGAVSLSGSIPTGTLPVANGGTALTSTTADRTLMVNNSGNALEWGFSGLIQCNVYTGNSTWSKPTGCTRVRVQVVGGGAGGSGHGVAGGAGGYSEEIIDVTGVSSVSVTIGGQGGGVNYHNQAGNGGTSSFGPYLSASGGEGARRVGGHTGGRPGIGSSGNINMYGGGGAGHTHHGGGHGGTSYFGGGNIGVHDSGPQPSQREGQAAPGSGGVGAPQARRRGASGKSGMVVVWSLR